MSGDVAVEVAALALPGEVAEFLRVSVQTLANWRSLGRGPVYVQFDDAGSIRYRWSDVEGWAVVNTVVPEGVSE